MKKIYNILFLLASVISFTACTPTVDDVFDKSSAERIHEAQAEDLKVLTSAPDGWVMEYFVGSQYGGYNVLCKFNQDNTVTVSSEAGAPDSVYTSHFKFEQSQGVLLSFDTHNPLFHYYSNPENPDRIGTNGVGMNGDFEFRVIKATADSVILVGKKHGARIVMTPFPKAKYSSWQDYLQKVIDVDKYMRFKYYDFSVAGKDTRISPSFRTLAIPNTVDGKTADENLGYIVTPEGFKFYKPYVINGKTLTGFKYVENAEHIFPEFTNGDISLKEAILPWSEQLINGRWFMKYSEIGKPAQEAWTAMLPNLEELAAGMGQEMNLNFAFLGTLDNTFGMVVNVGGYWGRLDLKSTIVDDTHVKLMGTGTGDNNGGIFIRSFGFGTYLAPFGVDERGRFKETLFEIKANDKKSPTEMTLTEVGNPDNFFKLYTTRINDPMNN